MYVKIYSAVYIAVVLAAALMFVTGNLTPIVAVSFGFLAFGLTFMGMMCVLPSHVGHNAPKARAAPETPNRLENMVDNTSEKFRKLGKDIAASGSIDMRKPKFP